MQWKFTMLVKLHWHVTQTWHEMPKSWCFFNERFIVFTWYTYPVIIVCRKRWQPGHRISDGMQRRFAVPQVYSRSVHVLTNEAVFKGWYFKTEWLVYIPCGKLIVQVISHAISWSISFAYWFHHGVYGDILKVPLGGVSLTFREFSKIFSQNLCIAEIILLMRISSWNFVRVPKAMQPSFSL